MKRTNNDNVTADDLMDNMIMYVDEFIEGLHNKDQSAVKSIDDNLSGLKDKLETIMSELSDSEEWSQDDLIELAANALLVAVSMGVPEDDEDDENEDDSDSEESEESDE